MKTTLTIMTLVLFSMSFSSAKSPEKVQLDKLDAEQSNNALELMGSGALIGASAIYSHKNHQQRLRLNVNILTDLVQHKNLTAIEIRKKKNAPTVKSLRKQKLAIQANITKNEGQIKSLKRFSHANTGLLITGVLGSTKSLFDAFQIRNEMKELIDCNPELLYQSVPLKKEQTVNVSELFNTAEALKKLN